MTNSVAIPQDIIDNIIEAVGDDRLLLKKCALVSSSFLLPSRKHLFSKVYLRDDDPEACQKLHQFLVENPVIQSFVRNIEITGNYGYTTSMSHSLIAILRLPFCCLESFSITGDIWCPSIWDEFSSELKNVLSTIIHSPTLKTLYLERVSVPIKLFHGIHLAKLGLTCLLLNDFFNGEQSRLLTSAASEEAAATAYHTVVDHCEWIIYSSVCGLTEPIFLPFMCCLRVFEIYISPDSATMSDFDILSFLIGSLRISLTSPATLEHLKFDIVFSGNDNHFDHDSFYDDLRDAAVWSHLDSIITHPTGSRLQRVDINIKYSFRYDDDVREPDEAKVMEPVLDALPLLREKGILFVNANGGW